MLLPYLIFVLGLLLFFALLTGLIARHRKADVPYWVFVALLIGPFALPLVFFARPASRLTKAS